MSTRRTRKDRGRVKHEQLPRGANGRALCRWCKSEVPPSRKSFCNDRCVHEWKLRTQPAYARACLLKRDDGKCSRCGCDSIILALELQILKRKDYTAWVKWYRKHGVSLSRRSMWDMHHKVAVSEGGGECGMSNLVTLCVLCHRLVTSQLLKRLSK